MPDQQEEQRFIVPSCCEDFILYENQGLLARAGEQFECFACRRRWEKTGPAAWSCLSDHVDYDIAVQEGDLEARLYFLSPRNARQPLTRRCCQNMIRFADPKIWQFLQTSPRWSVENLTLTCLSCGCSWRPRLVEVLGWQKLCYDQPGLPSALVLQDLPSGRVLVPLDEWSP